MPASPSWTEPGSAPSSRKKLDAHAEHPRDLRQTERAHPVLASLVFLDLLVAEAEGLPQLLLRKPAGAPPQANAPADQGIDRVAPLGVAGTVLRSACQPLTCSIWPAQS